MPIHSVQVRLSLRGRWLPPTAVSYSTETQKSSESLKRLIFNGLGLPHDVSAIFLRAGSGLPVAVAPGVDGELWLIVKERQAPASMFLRFWCLRVLC